MERVAGILRGEYRMINLGNIIKRTKQAGIAALVIFPALLFFLFQSYIQFPIDDLDFCNGLFSVIWFEALLL